MSTWRLVGIVLMGAFFFACGPDRDSTLERPDADLRPLGTWFMYGGSSTGLIGEEAAKHEETVLLLSDSFYTLTFKRPDINLTFVETGKVVYDLTDKDARFTVLSASGVDWSSGEPRKLLNVQEAVPFQRDPGTVYTMTWSIHDGILRLAAPGYETSWFVPMPTRSKEE